MRDTASNRTLLIGLTIVIAIIGILMLIPADQLQKIISPFQTKKETKPLIPPSPTPIIASENLPNDKLIPIMKKLGFDLLWRDPNDSTGRTLLYRDRGISYYLIGELTAIGAEGLKQVASYVGVAEKLEEIPKSRDMYITVIDPRNKTQIGKARIMMETKGKPTLLWIESLNLNLNRTENPEPLLRERLGFMEKWRQWVPNLILAGDGVVLQVRRDSQDKNVKDENGYYVIESITIHRFKGKAAILQGLNITQTPP